LCWTGRVWLTLRSIARHLYNKSLIAADAILSSSVQVLLNSEGTEEGSLLKLLSRCITPFGVLFSGMHASL
jgi:hypothetical protein